MKFRQGRVVFITGATGSGKTAFKIARQQQAKSWELRAVKSLSQLWRKQGEQEEARQLLVEVYTWFTEGVDTTDLKEAKALIKELP